MIKTEKVLCMSHVIGYMENIPQELFSSLASENKILKKKLNTACSRTNFEGIRGKVNMLKCIKNITL